MESCLFEADDLETTQHFGHYLNQELVGVISLFKKNNPDFLEIIQYQIRGMAVLESYQKKGFGKALILQSEEYYKNESVDLIWFNARTEALVSTKKWGFHSKFPMLDKIL